MAADVKAGRVLQPTLSIAAKNVAKADIGGDSLRASSVTPSMGDGPLYLQPSPATRNTLRIKKNFGGFWGLVAPGFGLLRTSSTQRCGTGGIGSQQPALAAC